MKDFETQVTKLLELTNISEWDRQVFKEREQKIRDAAIILAGQCIALFLYNLSQSQEAMDTAINQTRGWWYPETQRHGLRKRQILTVGNVLVTIIIPYLITKTEKDSKNKSESKGFYPFLKWLGMEEGLTPLVWSTIAQYGAISGSFETACTFLVGWGINISLRRIERLTYKFGKIGINLRQSKILNRKSGNLPSGNVLKGQRVVIAVDGSRTKIRINKKGRKKAKTNCHGFTGVWDYPDY